jgi:hypothetical protein
MTTLALLAALALALRAEDASDAAALVVTASGPLSVSERSGGVRSIGALEWLPSGSTLDSGRQTALVALAGGRRFELLAGARVRVAPDRLEVLAGTAHELERVPPIPKVARLAAHEQAGTRSGAMRIRGRRIGRLYPRGEAVTLAEATTLRFSPEPGIVDYQVELEDDEGATVFHVATRGGEVLVARDVLRPGRRYRWSVRGGSADGLARGEAEFSTLELEAAAARQKLVESIGDSQQVAALALLAEVDRQLGLLLEARDRFALAVERAPGSSELSAALRKIEAQLRDETPTE